MSKKIRILKNSKKQNKMEHIILISNCWERVEIGYVSTSVKINRATNAIISVSYSWHENFGLDSKFKNFDSFESLNTFINELVEAEIESELNSLEMPSYKG